jgi:hypothetical protein
MKNSIIGCVIFFCSVISVSGLSAEETGDIVIESGSATGIVVLYRTADRSSMNYRFSVDGKYAGKLKRDSSMQFELSEGEHVIAASDPRHTRLVVNVSQQQVTYIRTDIDKKSRLSLVPTEVNEQLLVQN